ncbi:MAG: N-acetyltransferase [Rhodobacteraceae bacterium]|nr:N-acetyltransferase [Paracoccaceae bacterium]
MTIRLADPADAAAIAAIWNPYIRDTMVTFNWAEKSPQEVATMIEVRQQAGCGTWLAQEAGRPLGFASYSQFRGGVGYTHTMEHTILLAPEARGRGVGRALMRALEDHARAGGVHSMFAGVSAANPEGVAFHAALGYGQVARLAEVGFKAGRWLDLVLMQKILTP